MNRIPYLSRSLILLLGLIGVTPCQAADPASNPPRSPLNPLLYRDVVFHQIHAVTRSEGLEMVRAILDGSQMGPGEGWFHSGKSRYSWDWLAENYDADKDGKITRKEFPGDDALFARLDRNHDGVLTADDFDWSDNSPFLQKMGMARGLFSMLDANSNGRISRSEWEAFFKKAAKDKD